MPFEILDFQQRALAQYLLAKLDIINDLDRDRIASC